MKKILFVLLLVVLAYSCMKKISVQNEDNSEYVVWIPGDRDEYGFYYDMFENFKRYKESSGEAFGYKIEQQPWGDYWTKLPLEINNGRGPDIFLAHMAYVDILKPISKGLDFTPDLLNQFYVTEFFTDPNGRPYFIPTLFVSKIMYANKDLYPDYQNYPKTWEELEQVAASLSDTSKGIIGFDYSYHIIWDLGYQNGFTLTAPIGQPQFSGARKALPYIQRWENSGISNVLSYGNGDSENSFYEGTSAIIYGEPWMQFWAPNAINTFAFPVPGGQTHNVAELSFGISKNVSDNQFKVLNQFVEFMLTDRDTITAIVKGNSGFPNNKNIQVSYEAGSAGDAVTKTFQSDSTFLIITPSTLERAYRTMLGNFITSKDIDVVIQEAEISLQNANFSLLSNLEDDFRGRN